MNRTNFRQSNVALKPQPRKRFRFPRGRHDPWLVLNMSIFNFERGRNEIFNPIHSHQNIWC
jgi:hypothetical protein